MKTRGRTSQLSHGLALVLLIMALGSPEAAFAQADFNLCDSALSLFTMELSESPTAVYFSLDDSVIRVTYDGDRFHLETLATFSAPDGFEMRPLLTLNDWACVALDAEARHVRITSHRGLITIRGGESAGPTRELSSYYTIGRGNYFSMSSRISDDGSIGSLMYLSDGTGQMVKVTYRDSQILTEIVSEIDSDSEGDYLSAHGDGLDAYIEYDAGASGYVFLLDGPVTGGPGPDLSMSIEVELPE